MAKESGLSCITDQHRQVVQFPREFYAGDRSFFGFGARVAFIAQACWLSFDFLARKSRGGNYGGIGHLNGTD
ncbi:MAG: hypothetical protein ACLQVJ_06040 [Syntrophobacteraceae bacterium]